MDLANGYLAHTMHEQNLAAADRINAYRRRVAERREFEAQAASNASDASTGITPVGHDRSRWDRMVGALTPSRSHAALPGRP
jgi:hypothetical protein